MQPFELVLITTSAFYLLFDRFIQNRIPKSLIVMTFLLIASLHLIIEGWRWQMIPAYVLWVWGLVTAFLDRKVASTLLVRMAKYLSVFFLFIIGIGLPSILPVFDLPRATGKHEIGTTDLLLHTQRKEEITPESEDLRSLMIKVWYPIEKPGKTMDSYVDQAGRDGFAMKYGLPSFILDYLDKINTNVYRDAPIIDHTLPVLIFSHGYHSKANGYYSLLSEMASHGYIVFALNHTYESTGTTFLDGSTAYFNNEYAQSISDDGSWDQVAPAIDAFKSDMTFEDRHPLVKNALQSYFVKNMQGRWAQDIIETIDHLSIWNETSRFKGKLDLDKVGVFGHSRGGGAAGVALLKDERIKAAANLDGVQWGDIVDTSFQQPFLFLSADWPESHENLNEHAYINKSTDIFYEAMIRQSGHSNFMDIPNMIPVRAVSQAGKIDPELCTEITRNLLVYFFNNHVKGISSDIEALADRYDELEMSVFK